MDKLYGERSVLTSHLKRTCRRRDNKAVDEDFDEGKGKEVEM